MALTPVLHRVYLLRPECDAAGLHKAHHGACIATIKEIVMSVVRVKKSRVDVVVVGAGAAGLSTAHALQREGLSFRLLEKADRIGMPWRNRHPQLRLNTHRDISHLPGLRLPKSAHHFPARDDLVRYLEDYVRVHELPVELGAEVVSIIKRQAGWLVQTRDEAIRTAHVVIATGRDAEPVMPDWPGRDVFVGKLIHAADFGDARQYGGKHVLVAGAGNSGADILNHLSRMGVKSVQISIRHGSAISPGYLFGFPVQRMAPLMERLPLRLADRMIRDTQRFAFGDLTRYGFPMHVAGAASRLAAEGVSPAVDHGFVAAVKAGLMWVVPEIERFEGRDVVFRGGRRTVPDVVIAATGYRTGLEPLLGHLGVLDARGVPLVSGPETLAHAPGLWCIGMHPRLGGALRAANRDGRAIVRRIATELAVSRRAAPEGAARLAAEAGSARG